MLEVRNYRKAELVEMLGTRDNEGLKYHLYPPIPSYV